MSFFVSDPSQFTHSIRDNMTVWMYFYRSIGIFALCYLASEWLPPLLLTRITVNEWLEFASLLTQEKVCDGTDLLYWCKVCVSLKAVDSLCDGTNVFFLDVEFASLLTQVKVCDSTDFSYWYKVCIFLNEEESLFVKKKHS